MQWIEVWFANVLLRFHDLHAKKTSQVPLYSRKTGKEWIWFAIISNPLLFYTVSYNLL